MTRFTRTQIRNGHFSLLPFKSSGLSSILRFFTLAFCISLFSALSSAQPPTKVWDVRFGGTGTDAMYGIARTNDLGYILGGDSDSPISGDKTQSNQGMGDYWVLKTDSGGAKLWDKRFGGNAREEMYAVTQTIDNGYFLAGWSESGISGDKTQASQGMSDFWVVKTDQSGLKMWDTRFGGTSSDNLRDARPTSDGGFILAGESLSGIGGDKTENSRGAYDYWMVKINASGAKQWDARFGGSSDDLLRIVQQTSDGGYILAGWSESGIGGDQTQPGKGSTDYWLVKTDANGEKQWDARYGGNGHEYLYSLGLTSDGGYIIGGYSNSDMGGDVSEDSKGGYDFWIVKADANGVKEWDKRIGGNKVDKLKAIRQTVDGGYVIAGWSDSDLSGDKSQACIGKSDYWTVRLNESGAKLWDLVIGGAGEDRVHSIMQTASGGYLLAGHTYSVKGNDVSQNSQGLSDYWIVKLTGETAAQTFYFDDDEDGYGDPAIDSVSLVQPAGYVSNDNDCNDSNSNIHPGAVDLCNSLDDDCNAVIDDHAIDTVTVSPDGQTATCEGIPLILTATTQSGAAYQWFKNGSIIAGATMNSYSANQDGLFTVQVSNSFGCNATSAISAVYEVPYPVPVITPSGIIEACQSVPVTLTANFNPDYSYQWYKGEMALPGATSNEVTVTKSGKFKVVETVSVCSATSAATTIHRSSKPPATITPLGNLDICATGSVTLQANTGIGFTYQWLKNAVNIAGATQNTYVATAVGNYKVKVANSIGCSKTSDVAKVTKSCKLDENGVDVFNTEIIIAPNPASSYFTLSYNFESEHSAHIRIANVIGEIVYDRTFTGNNGSVLNIPFDKHLPNGLYLVTMECDNMTFTNKLIIER